MMETPIKIWKPSQVFLASYLSGPLGGAFLIYENYLVLQQPSRARNTLFLGFGLMVIFSIVSALIPFALPPFLWPLLTAISLQTLVRFHQEMEITSLLNGGAARYSYGRLLLIGILALVIQTALAFFIALPMEIIMEAIGEL